MKVYADNERLQYSGRIDFDNPKAPVLVYAASFVRMKFTGTSVKAVLRNYKNYWDNYMGCIIDGTQTKFLLEDDENPHAYVLAEGLGDGVHELTLFKRMDSCHTVTFYGFELDEGARPERPDPLPARRMEVFGDSVSCGEVSEALAFAGKPDPEHNGEWSNSWYSYAWMTARRLGAELHDTSQGGIALLDGTGWFAEPDYRGMESCYDKIEYHPGLGAVKNWDFESWQPHVVVAAIGQNDSHPEDYMAKDYGGSRAGHWRRRYEEWVKELMRLYPRAQFILTTTILEHDPAWDRAIDEVCRSISDARVRRFYYRRNGAGTPGHIRIPEAEEMAEELSSYIESLGDIWQEVEENDEV